MQCQSVSYTSDTHCTRRRWKTSIRHCGCHPPSWAVVSWNATTKLCCQMQWCMERRRRRQEVQEKCNRLEKSHASPARNNRNSIATRCFCWPRVTVSVPRNELNPSRAAEWSAWNTSSGCEAIYWVSRADLRAVISNRERLCFISFVKAAFN